MEFIHSETLLQSSSGTNYCLQFRGLSAKQVTNKCLLNNEYINEWVKNKFSVKSSVSIIALQLLMFYSSIYEEEKKFTSVHLGC